MEKNIVYLVNKEHDYNKNSWPVLIVTGLKCAACGKAFDQARKIRPGTSKENAMRQYVRLCKVCYGIAKREAKFESDEKISRLSRESPYRYLFIPPEKPGWGEFGFDNCSESDQ